MSEDKVKRSKLYYLEGLDHGVNPELNNSDLFYP